VILINGEHQDVIAATDRGLHYGDGVFETIAIRTGKPQFWAAHMERLLDGCARLSIPIPDVTLLTAETERLCTEGEDAVLKIIITRGSGGRGYRPPFEPEPQRILIRYPWPEHHVPDEGITLRQCHTPLSCNPVLAGIKHLNRLEQVLARNEWSDESIHEGVMCDTEGYVIEGTMSNLFAVRDGVLITPELSNCGVAGIMRQQVMAVAQHLSIPCEHVRFKAEELNSMDELFITNSIIGVWPVARFNELQFSKGVVTEKLMKGLAKMVEQS